MSIKKIKKVLTKIGIIIIVILILFWCHSVYISTGDYMIYSIKTVGQTKHKLTVYVEYAGTGKPSENISVEVVQKIGSIRDIRAAEKEITYRETDENGIVVFYLLPGIYRCREKGSYGEYTNFIDLNSDKEVTIDISLWAMPQGR